MRFLKRGKRIVERKRWKQDKTGRTSIHDYLEVIKVENNETY